MNVYTLHFLLNTPSVLSTETLVFMSETERDRVKSSIQQSSALSGYTEIVCGETQIVESVADILSINTPYTSEAMIYIQKALFGCDLSDKLSDVFAGTHVFTPEQKVQLLDLISKFEKQNRG